MKIFAAAACAVFLAAPNLPAASQPAPPEREALEATAAYNRALGEIIGGYVSVMQAAQLTAIFLRLADDPSGYDSVGAQARALVADAHRQLDALDAALAAMPDAPDPIAGHEQLRGELRPYATRLARIARQQAEGWSAQLDALEGGDVAAYYELVGDEGDSTVVLLAADTALTKVMQSSVERDFPMWGHLEAIVIGNEILSTLLTLIGGYEQSLPATDERYAEEIAQDVRALAALLKETEETTEESCAGPTRNEQQEDTLRALCATFAEQNETEREILAIMERYEAAARLMAEQRFDDAAHQEMVDADAALATAADRRMQLQFERQEKSLAVVEAFR